METSRKAVLGVENEVSEAIDIPFGKQSFIRKVKTRAQTKNIVAIFRFNQKIIFRPIEILQLCFSIVLTFLMNEVSQCSKIPIVRPWRGLSCLGHL